MHELPDNSIGLAVTSPPYNASKQYDEDLSLDEYLALITNVGAEVYRTLRPGGRYAINIANLGRKPYIPLTAYFYQVHMELGFLPMGEVIWQKGKGASGSTAWGSWMNARSPRLRDLHEYVLIFAKQAFSRPDRGETNIEKEEFMAGTLSMWEIPPESAKRIGHPAPFPVALADRLIRLLSYQGDVILDPFIGSGTTAVAAILAGRHFVGYDTEENYIALANERIQAAQQAS
jgi:site-specific DNA-methyltransferase (adenine-specific)